MDQEKFVDMFTKFKLLDGTGIPYFYTQPGQYTQPIVVLVHDIGGNAKHWSAPVGADLPSSQTWLFDTEATPTDINNGGYVRSPDYESRAVRTWCTAFSAANMSFVVYSQKVNSKIEADGNDLVLLLEAVEAQLYDASTSPPRTEPPLIILCHGRGGLVTRSALNTIKKNNRDLPHLSKVITLGTPHSGSYMPSFAKDFNDKKISLDTGDLKQTLNERITNFGSSKDAVDQLAADISNGWQVYLQNAFNGASTLNEACLELDPNSPIFGGDLKEDKPWAAVSYYSFGGYRSDIISFYTPARQKVLTFSDSETMNLLLRVPGLEAKYGNLEELSNGDSSVALKRSVWPAAFKAVSYNFPMTHMQALINYDLQNAVINLIQGKSISDFVSEVESKNTPSFAWLSDPTVSAIHDAFLLGWTNSELKSRIKLAILDQLIESKCRQSDEVPPTDTSILTSLKSAILYSFGSTQAGPHFIKGSIEVPLLPVGDSNVPNSIKLTSLWRSLFNRLAELHYKRFPLNKTQKTAYEYDPAASGKDWSFLNDIDHNTLNFGIRSLDSLQDAEGNDITPLADFGLYEITRRTMNCLSLLFTDARESLITTTIIEFQQQLLLNQVKDVGKRKVTADDWSTVIQKFGTLLDELLEAWDGYLREQYFSGGAFKNDEVELIAYEAGRALANLTWITSVQVEPLERLIANLNNDKDKDRLQKTLDFLKGLKLPDQMDLSVVQRTFDYWKGVNPNPVPTLAIPSTDELTATDKTLVYLNGLSSNPIPAPAIPSTVELAATKKTLAYLYDWIKAQKQNPPVPHKDILALEKTLGYLNGLDATREYLTTELTNEICNIWKNVFAKSEIAELQHQITSLTTALDAAFFKANPALKGTLVDPTPSAPNPDLPSLAIHSIRHSLNYWQRTIQLVCHEDNETKPVASIKRPKTYKIGGYSISRPLKGASQNSVKNGATKEKDTLYISGDWPQELRVFSLK